ncbi:MAG: transcriptional regulator [Gammaproteobacteria bacterium]|nr:transcriptional regulator [Gammaproteobacteria bacterium]
MPIISMFYGIIIQMFWNEHAPPHFHALYAEYEAVIDIRTLNIMKGSMPRRALSLVLEWASQHQSELMEDWQLCEQNEMPRKISPLE